MTAKHLLVHAFKDLVVPGSCVVIQERVKYYDPSVVIDVEGLGKCFKIIPLQIISHLHIISNNNFSVKVHI